MGEFSGKIALVTGASRGIGRAIAVDVAREGAYVFVNYNNSEKKAEETLRQIKRAGGRGALIKADVSSYSDVNVMRREIVDAKGDALLLVNNAGIHQHLKSWEMTVQDWHNVVNTNLSGTYYCCREFAPAMIKRKWGRIVNISSVCVHIGTDHEAHYGASKGGLITLTRALALELAPYGVRVNCVAPGHILTDMSGLSTPKEIAAAAKKIPLGRLGAPKDIAAAVAFLLSDKSSYVTGETMNVNGGLAFA